MLKPVFATGMAIVLLGAAGWATAQRAVPPTPAPVPTITPVPALPVQPITPIPPIAPPPPIAPLTPAPAIDAGSISRNPPAVPLAPRNPCQLANPPAYCAERGSVDGGGEDSCSQTERACVASGSECLRSLNLTDSYFVAYSNSRPAMFHRDGASSSRESEMRSCQERLEACLRQNNC